MSYTAKDAYSLIEKGEYEMQVTSIKFMETNSGKEYLSVGFKIREDVEQPFKNRFVFENIWKEKDNPEYYNRKRIGSLLRTQGSEIEANDIEEVVEIMEGAYLIGVVDTVFNDYTGTNENKIKFYKPSKVGEQTLSSEPKLDITAEDLPF